MTYHTFTDEDGNTFGSFEIFEEKGFYWWPCFPDCLPDTDDDPIGPFPSYDAAFQDAQDFAEGGN